jgi:hypothetical protein
MISKAGNLNKKINGKTLYLKHNRILFYAKNVTTKLAAFHEISFPQQWRKEFRYNTREHCFQVQHFPHFSNADITSAFDTVVVTTLCAVIAA